MVLIFYPNKTRMKNSYWYLLIVVSLISITLFEYLDNHHGNLFLDACSLKEDVLHDMWKEGYYNDSEYFEKKHELFEEPIENKFDVSCAVSEEIFEPFIWLSYIFFIVIAIMFSIEKRKRKLR